jgi:hypothetical protein
MKNWKKSYSGIENWSYNNLITDLLKAYESTEVLKRQKIDEKNHIFHYASCTIDINYSKAKRLSLRVIGEKNKSKKVLETLEKKIDEYNREYCDPTGLKLKPYKIKENHSLN